MTNFEPAQLPAIDRPVVMFVISRTFGDDVSKQSLYDSTRGNWRIGEESRNRAKIALGIADGVVKTAYSIDNGERPTTNTRQEKDKARRTAGTSKDTKPTRRDPGLICPFAISHRPEGARILSDFSCKTFQGERM